MHYWLVKSEPEAYSFADLQRDKKTDWDGVRNYQARNNLRDMQKGDLVMVYHSVSEKAIVGIAKVTKPHFQDSKTDDKNWVAVELSAHKELKNKVTLAQIKATPALENIGLLKQSRLSVMPLKKEEFDKILELGM